MRFARNPPRRLVDVGFRRFEREERGVRNEIRPQSAAALGELGEIRDGARLLHVRWRRDAGLRPRRSHPSLLSSRACRGGLTLNSVRLSLRRRSDWRSSFPPSPVSFPPSPTSSPIYIPSFPKAGTHKRGEQPCRPIPTNPSSPQIPLRLRAFALNFPLATNRPFP